MLTDFIISYINGLLYYVKFIDDFSKKTQKYFMKTKDELLNRFQEFKVWVENLIRKKINILRSDNGGYLTSKDFNDLCKDIGIKRELTVHYNPQQNGIAKSKNMSIRKVVRKLFMIITYPCSYGHKHPTQKFIFITKTLKEYQGIRIMSRNLQE